MLITVLGRIWILLFPCFIYLLQISSLRWSIPAVPKLLRQQTHLILCDELSWATPDAPRSIPMPYQDPLDMFSGCAGPSASEYPVVAAGCSFWSNWKLHLQTRSHFLSLLRVILWVILEPVEANGMGHGPGTTWNRPSGIPNCGTMRGIGSQPSTSDCNPPHMNTQPTV